MEWDEKFYVWDRKIRTKTKTYKEEINENRSRVQKRPVADSS